jgi:uroporphyrinogen-III decarboxylase
MTNQHWQILCDVINNKSTSPTAGFIIDSPWLPGWAGISTLDYYTSDKLWLEANLRAMTTFSDAFFIPGFWSEYGMCTEPSAFGSRLTWSQSNLPHAEKIIHKVDDIFSIPTPNVKTDGLLPFVINRLKQNETAIQKSGHEIRFAIARGPLNIASFLMGTTEFLMAIAMNPDKVHALLEKIVVFTVDWLQYQKECFPSIDGIIILDDIVGFIGDDDFRNFALLHLKRIFSSFNASVKLFHNDAQGLVCAPYLHEIGVNVFNFAFSHSMGEMRKAVGEKVTLLGNLPPRDVLAAGTPAQVADACREMKDSIDDHSRIIWSCGGGMPQDVSSENIHAFIKTIQNK